MGKLQYSICRISDLLSGTFICGAVLLTEEKQSQLLVSRLSLEMDNNQITVFCMFNYVQVVVISSPHQSLVPSPVLGALLPVNTTK